MLFTTSTLLEAAQSASQQPHVRVQVADRDANVQRLRLDRWYEGDEDPGRAAAAIAGYTARDAILALQPAGYWPLGEASGDALDHSGNGNDGTVTLGSGTRATDPLDAAGDGSMTFDASRIVVADDTAIRNPWAGGGALLALVYPEGPGGSNFWTIAEAGSIEWGLYLTQATAPFHVRFDHRFSSTHGSWEARFAVPADEVSAVLLLYDKDDTANDPTVIVSNSGGLTTYTVGDGLFENTTPAGTAHDDTGSGFVIGARAGGALDADGRIDELVVWQGEQPTILQLQDYLALVDEAQMIGRHALVRARLDGDDLQVARVADPGPTSDYDVWTSVATVDLDGGLGLHAAGGRVLVAYLDDSTSRPFIRESIDAGVTFGSATVLDTLTGGDAIACGIRADGEAVVAYEWGDDLYYKTRPAGGSWSARAAWSHSLDSINAIVIGDVEDWAFLVSGEDDDSQPGCWSTRFTTSWSALAPIIVAAPDLDVSYRATGLMYSGAPRAVVVESYAGSGAFDRVLLATAIGGGFWADGDWRDPVPLDQTTVPAEGLGAAAFAVDAYLVTPDGVWHTAAGSSPVEVTDAVLRARYQASPAAERLRLHLDPGLLEETEALLEVGTEISYWPGYITSEGAEVITGRVLWVTEVERRRGMPVEVHAEGAVDRLQRWRAPRQITWPAGDSTIAQIANEIVETATGLNASSTTGRSSAATTLTPGFTVRPGESAASALARLIARIPDQVWGRGYNVFFDERDAEEAPGYDAYGLAHTLYDLSLGDRAGDVPGWVRVIGDGAAGDAIGDPEDGPVALVEDEAVTDGSVAAARAAAVLRRAVLAEHRGILEAAPHPGHEPGDVIAVTDPTLALNAEPYRLTWVEIDYSTHPRARYRMRLGLGHV